MEKSSLKTFLAGKNGYSRRGAGLKGADWAQFLEDVSDSWEDEDGSLWHIDVLDDGTTITYAFSK